MNSPEGVTRFRIVSAIPGRIRVRFEPEANARARLDLYAARIGEIEAIGKIRVVADAGSLVIAYERQALSLSAFTKQVNAILQEAILDAEAQGALVVSQPDIGTRLRSLPGQTEVLHAMNLANDRPAGFKPLVISTVAVAAALTEAAPFLIVAGFFALAALPVARRAAKDSERKQLSVDQIDILNIALTVVQAGILPAAVIAWLSSAAELIRGKTVGYSRQSISRLLPAAEEELTPRMRRAIEQIYLAELSNTRLQDNAMRAGHLTMVPLAVLALGTFAATGNPSVLINIARPRTDYQEALQLGIPVPILNALTATREDGPLLTSAAAVEGLARMDVLLVQPGIARQQLQALEELQEALQQRGIRMHYLSAKETTAETLIRLKAEGHTLGLLGEKSDLPFIQGVDVRVLLDRDPEMNIETADLFLLESGMPGLLRAWDNASEAMRLTKTNTGVFAAASLTNLTIALASVAPPWFANLINMIAMATVGSVTVRPLSNAPAKRRDPRRLQKVIPAGKPAQNPS